MMTFGIILVVIVSVFILLMIISAILYSSIIKERNSIEAVETDIYSKYQDKYNSILSLLDILKDYAKADEYKLNKLTKAKQSYAQAESLELKERADRLLIDAVESIYLDCDLKDNGDAQDITKSIKDTEDEIKSLKEKYNRLASKYNRRISAFPFKIVAYIFNFSKKPYISSESSLVG